LPALKIIALIIPQQKDGKYNLTNFFLMNVEQLTLLTDERKNLPDIAINNGI
jgi:hypothetical protein